LSATLTVAENCEAEGGVKVTAIEHCAPAARVEAQEFVRLKAVGFAPASVTPVMLTLELPVFVRVRVWAALVVPLSWLAKATVAGVSVARKVGASVPVPLNGALCGEPAALSVTEIAAE
jgi:hypothetical protein